MSYSAEPTVNRTQELVTANHAFTVFDEASQVSVPIFRCGKCFALVERSHAVEHLNWHSSLLLAPS